jgi:hypothetical protein
MVVLWRRQEELLAELHLNMEMAELLAAVFENSGILTDFCLLAGSWYRLFCCTIEF